MPLFLVNYTVSPAGAITNSGTPILGAPFTSKLTELFEGHPPTGPGEKKSLEKTSDIVRVDLAHAFVLRSREHTKNDRPVNGSLLESIIRHHIKNQILSLLESNQIR
jgi:hypothetical protein